MHDITILGQIMGILAIAVVVVFLSQKLRVPSIVGFLAAGLIVGPVGLGLVPDHTDIELIAEIGVALLLFTVGLEVSLGDMMRLARTVFGGGGAQVGLTLAITAGLALLLGLETRVALLVGALVALSSTAIVLKLTSERGETDSIHGRTLLGVLIFQDLAFVPFLLMIPVLSGADTDAGAVLLVLGKAAGVIAGMLFLGRFLFPKLLDRVVAARNRELFTLSVIVLALGTAYLSALAGLSLALGAFVAGMVISDSEYGQQALADITPFRDTFNSLFFVSIGMLINPEVILAQPLLIVGLVLGVVILKALVAGGVSLALGHPLRVAILVGLGLAQVGEFSFVLAQLGARSGLLDSHLHQVFLAGSVITMALTPLLTGLSYRASQAGSALLDRRLRRLSEAARARIDAVPDAASCANLSDHVVIVGYGVNGRNVARVLRKLQVRHVIIELNPGTVRSARAAGESIVYGDASGIVALEHVGAARARAVVVTIPDVAAVRRVVAQVKRLRPTTVVVARTRYESEVGRLHELGADAVVPEEFETSLALAGIVMATYGASRHAIDREKESIRAERYALLSERGQTPPTSAEPSLGQLLSAIDMRIVRVGAERACAADSCALGDLRLRTRSGASVIAVLRGGEVLPNPGPEAVLRAGDHLALLGRPEQIDAATQLLGGAFPSTD